MQHWIERSAQLLEENRVFLLATIIRVAGSAPREVGARMIVFEGGEFEGTIGGGGLEKAVLADAPVVLKLGSPETRQYPLTAEMGHACGGSVDVYFEPMGLGPKLYIFGAGHVGQALARVLEGTPFRIHLIDQRREWLESPHLPSHLQRHADEPSAFIAKAAWSAKSVYVTILSWSHEVDFEILSQVVLRPVKYLGVIGSKNKSQLFLRRLRETGIADSVVESIRCPMGLPLGGKTPQEIAISIAGELLKTHYENSKS